MNVLSPLFLFFRELPRSIGRNPSKLSLAVAGNKPERFGSLARDASGYARYTLNPFDSPLPGGYNSIEFCLMRQRKTLKKDICAFLLSRREPNTEHRLIARRELNPCPGNGGIF